VPPRLPWAAGRDPGTVAGCLPPPLPHRPSLVPAPSGKRFDRERLSCLSNCHVPHVFPTRAKGNSRRRSPTSAAGPSRESPGENRALNGCRARVSHTGFAGWATTGSLHRPPAAQSSYGGPARARESCPRLAPTTKGWPCPSERRLTTTNDRPTSGSRRSMRFAVLHRTSNETPVGPRRKIERRPRNHTTKAAHGGRFPAESVLQKRHRLESANFVVDRASPSTANPTSIY